MRKATSSDPRKISTADKFSKELLKSVHYIVIDIGSGAVRIVGFGKNAEEIFFVRNKNIQLGLYEIKNTDSDEKKYIAESQARELIKYLESEVKKIRNSKLLDSNIIIVGTEPFRATENGDAVRHALSQALTLKVNILTEKEEMILYAEEAARNYPSENIIMGHCGNGNFGVVRVCCGVVGTPYAFRGGGAQNPLCDMSKFPEALKIIGAEETDRCMLTGNAFCSLAAERIGELDEKKSLLLPAADLIRNALRCEVECGGKPLIRIKRAYAGMIITSWRSAGFGAGGFLLDRRGMRESLVWRCILTQTIPAPTAASVPSG